jgi:hypothetical protein
MLKRILPAIILIVLNMLIMLTGCSSNKNISQEAQSNIAKASPSIKNEDNSFVKYENALKNKIDLSTKQDINNLNITFSKEVENGYISQLIFSTKNGVKYEGVDYAVHDKYDNWNIIDENITPIDLKVPFTHMETSGTTKEGLNYIAISGVINDKNIASVKITYFDKHIVQVMKSELNQTYAFIRTDSNKGANKMEGYSKANKLIYSY